jgi:hypothetical protein
MESEQAIFFWRNIFLVGVFIVLTPIVLFASLISLFSLGSSNVKAQAQTSKINANPSKIGVSMYASLPSNVPSVSGFVTAGDARPEIVRQYLDSYNSPLAPYSEEIVKVADKYGIDFRFIPAIAQQESNLCHVIPVGSYNCWGWGITSVSSLGFDSYSDAIETVTKGLKKNYIDEGLVTPDEIMTKYTPSSNGSWANGVNEFMAAMK